MVEKEFFAAATAENGSFSAPLLDAKQ